MDWWCYTWGDGNLVRSLRVCCHEFADCDTRCFSKHAGWTSPAAHIAVGLPNLVWGRLHIWCLGCLPRHVCWTADSKHWLTLLGSGFWRNYEPTYRKAILLETLKSSDCQHHEKIGEVSNNSRRRKVSCRAIIRAAFIADAVNRLAYRRNLAIYICFISL